MRWLSLRVKTFVVNERPSFSKTVLLPTSNQGVGGRISGGMSVVEAKTCQSLYRYCRTRLGASISSKVEKTRQLYFQCCWRARRRRGLFSYSFAANQLSDKIYSVYTPYVCTSYRKLTLIFNSTLLRSSHALTDHHLAFYLGCNIEILRFVFGRFDGLIIHSIITPLRYRIYPSKGNILTRNNSSAQFIMN